MQLSPEVIEENKNTFLSILEPIVLGRPGANWEGLKTKLLESDFFSAPASTKYHAVYEGGLCDHSLNVYYNLCSLVKNKHLENEITPDSIAIVALLHDFSKINFYTKTARNKKVYYPAGTKHDELGKFDWVSELSYTTLPDEERFIYGNHEETAEFMVRSFIPLTYIESAAILCHHGGMGYDSTQGGMASKVMAKYPLATLLHIADVISVYIDEKLTNE